MKRWLTLKVLVIDKVPIEKTVKDIYIIEDNYSMAFTPLVIWYSDPPKAIAVPEIFILKSLVVRGLAPFPH